MACPACRCKETYQYDDWDDFGTSNEETQRCAACGAIFQLEDELPEDDDDMPPNAEVTGGPLAARPVD